MGVSIMWKPVKNEGKGASFGHRSKALETIKKVFGDQLHDDAIGKLRAMAEATGEEGYNELADAISEHGSIEVWGEY